MSNTKPDDKSLKNQLDRAQRDLQMLYDISIAMRSTLELQSILYIILTSVTAHYGLGFNRAILFLVDPHKRNLIPEMAIGPDSLKHAQEIWQYIENQNHLLDDLIEENISTQNRQPSTLFKQISDLKIPLVTDKRNLLADVYHSGEPKHLDESVIKAYLKDPLLEKFKTDELVVMPLKARDRVKGIIVADNRFTKDPITDESLRMFTMLANQAGLAIENSQLYEKIKHKSYTDSLTDVYNHGFFQDQLSTEIEKATENDQPLCLLMLDLDNFKKLNDEFGHQTGDQTLIKIADILKHSAREMDYICRYGGEEFVVILTNTDKDDAFTIAERIRENVASCRVKDLPDNHSVTVSIGIAGFPEDAQSKSELIESADRAMYVAKFSGKNRTCLHSDSR